MISDRAKDSFGRIFTGAARTRLAAREGDACEVAERTESVAPPSGANAQIVVLTISSMQFRLLLLLQFDDGEQMRAYYVRDAERSLQETFMEVANLCCGAVNQQLVEHFPDLGMSTPYALGSHCVDYLDELKPAWVASYDVTLGGAVRLGATLCVCANAPIDFAADAAVAEAGDSGGELELF